MRPVLILDCDEVILAFAEPFQRWLRAARAIALKFDSFALVGNMRHMASGEPVQPADFPALLDGFFAEGQGLQQPVPGVVEALSALRQTMDIVVLTNIPAAYRDSRAAALRGFGLDFPVHANDGSKGVMVRELANGKPAVFVDDLPPHHDSAAKHAPHVGRLHMVADATLAGLLPAAPAAHARIDDWARAEPWIRAWVNGPGRTKESI
jgi:hypothetical protein